MMAQKPQPVSLPRPRPASSVYSDDLPIMLDLINRVSQEIRVQECRTIASYMEEIQRLEEELGLYRRAWNGTITVANLVIRAVTIVKKGIATVDRREAKVGNDWMAFWRSYQESVGSHLPYI
jgi:hypothetical protein